MKYNVGFSVRGTAKNEELFGRSTCALVSLILTIVISQMKSSLDLESTSTPREEFVAYAFAGKVLLQNHWSASKLE